MSKSRPSPKSWPVVDAAFVEVEIRHQGMDPGRRPGPELVQPRKGVHRAEPEFFDQSPAWQPKEIPLDDGRILVLDYY